MSSGNLKHGLRTRLTWIGKACIILTICIYLFL